jgi:hypothetical protein
MLAEIIDIREETREEALAAARDLEDEEWECPWATCASQDGMPENAFGRFPQ